MSHNSAATPCPPRDATYDDLARYEDDLRITGAYLREALRLRQTARPCSVAVVLTKLDTLFGDPEEAKSQLTAEHLTDVLRPLVSLMQTSGKVARAAIFPVTAFGWGNAMVKPAEQNQGGPNGTPPQDGKHLSVLEHGELEWILRPGAAPQPYNLTSLVIWSMLNGMLHQEVEVDDDKDEHALARVCRLLSSDLESMDSWNVPLKGVRFSK